MAHFTPHQVDLASAETPAEIVSALCAVHGLVADLAGGEAKITFDEEAADLDRRYERASTLLRQRFDAIAADTATFSATGLAAIIGLDADRADIRRGAANHLSTEMRRSITALLNRLPL